MGEPKKGMEGLLLLLQRVRLEAARAAAAPAERLLDDVLRLLDPMRPIDDDQAYEVPPNPPLGTSVAQALCQKIFAQLPAQPVSFACCHGRHILLHRSQEG